MAIYHCTVKIIGRTKGQSVIESSAYRSGEILYSNYNGETYDYQKKHWIDYSEIILCENAPSTYKNRETLWNSVEDAEKSSSAQLAREIEVALPIELSREDQQSILREFIIKNFISKGLCADYSIHNPPIRNDRNQPIDIHGNPTNDISKMQFRNPHAHILTTMRTIDSDGKWESKTQALYVCKKDGIEKEFTSSEFDSVKKDGWEKQYQYKIEDKKIWCCPSEIKDSGAIRLSRTPKKVKFGKQNPTLAYLNAKERIFDWRNDWERVVNDKFKEKEMDTRIDARSYKDQGRVDEIPSKHMGVVATKIDRRAKRLLQEGVSKENVTFSDIGDINREIDRHNKLVQQIREAIEKLQQSTKETIQTIAHQLESLRAKIIGNQYQYKYLSIKRNIYKTRLFIDSDDYELKQSTYNRLEQSIKKLEISNKELKADYLKKHSEITPEIETEIEQSRTSIRSTIENAISRKLKEHYKEVFDDDLFKSSIRKTDKQLNTYIDEHSKTKHKTQKRTDSLERE